MAWYVRLIATREGTDLVGVIHRNMATTNVVEELDDGVVEPFRRTRLAPQCRQNEDGNGL